MAGSGNGQLRFATGKNVDPIHMNGIQYQVDKISTGMLYALCRSRVVLMIGDVIVWNSGRLSNYSNEAKKPKQCSSVCQGGHQACSQAPLSTLSTVVQDPSCFTSLNIKHPVKSVSELDWTLWTGSVVRVGI